MIPCPAKMSWILPIAVDGDARLDQMIEHRWPRRRHREVPSLGAPHERPGRTFERSGDHPPHAVRPGEESTGGPAPLVEGLESDPVLVGRDLEHGVPARVDDRPPGAQVLRAQPRDDLGPRGRHVPEGGQPHGRLERLHDLGREPVGVERERFVEPDPHHLPVPGGRVLARRAFGGAAVARPGVGGRRRRPRPRSAAPDPGRPGSARAGRRPLARVADACRSLRRRRRRRRARHPPPRSRRPRRGPAGPRSAHRSRPSACSRCRGSPTGAPRAARARSASRSARRSRRSRRPSSRAPGRPLAGSPGARAPPRSASIAPPWRVNGPRTPRLDEGHLVGIRVGSLVLDLLTQVGALFLERGAERVQVDHHRHLPCSRGGPAGAPCSTPRAGAPRSRACRSASWPRSRARAAPAPRGRRRRPRAGAWRTNAAASAASRAARCPRSATSVARSRFTLWRVRRPPRWFRNSAPAARRRGEPRPRAPQVGVHRLAREPPERDLAFLPALAEHPHRSLLQIHVVHVEPDAAPRPGVPAPYSSSRIARSRSPDGRRGVGRLEEAPDLVHRQRVRQRARELAAGPRRWPGRATVPSRRRNRWNERTDDSVRATTVARYGRSSSPCVEAESDATNDRIDGSSTSPGR